MDPSCKKARDTSFDLQKRLDMVVSEHDHVISELANTNQEKGIDLNVCVHWEVSSQDKDEYIDHLTFLLGLTWTSSLPMSLLRSG